MSGGPFPRQETLRSAFVRATQVVFRPAVGEAYPGAFFPINGLHEALHCLHERLHLRGRSLEELAGLGVVQLTLHLSSLRIHLTRVVVACLIVLPAGGTTSGKNGPILYSRFGTVTPRGTLRGIAACRQVLQKAIGDDQFALEQAEPEFEETEGDVICKDA